MFRSILGSVSLLHVLLSGLSAVAAAPDPIAACARAGNDDTVHPYTASLRPAFIKAYRRFGPQDRGLDTLQPSYYRCMGGKLLACFTGANLPCSKIVTARRNVYADAFCRAQRVGDKDIVPLSATGHDAFYSYHCNSGHAVVTGTNWTLDQRGFAKDIWYPMN